MIRQILTCLLCLTPMSTAFIASTESAFANSSNEIIPTKLANLPMSIRSQSTLTGGKVMPSTAKVGGYSLTDMAKALAYFTSSGNNPAYLPKTPFPILYLKDPNDPTKPSEFTVSSKDHIFLPLLFVSNASPNIGAFPAPPNQGSNYIFSQEQFGAKFQIQVDNKLANDIGSSYVAGPVYTPGLLNGGSQSIQVGVFLTPLSKGEHTITCRGTLSGKAFVDFAGEPLAFEFTYKVKVQ